MEVIYITVHYVYKFININSEIMYVGETNNIDRRIREHLSCNPSKTCFKRSDLKTISKIEYLTLKSSKEGKLVEKYYIRKYLSPNLKNRSIPRKQVKIKNPPDEWRTYKIFRRSYVNTKQNKIQLHIVVWFVRLFFWILIMYFLFK